MSGAPLALTGVALPSLSVRASAVLSCCGKYRSSSHDPKLLRARLAVRLPVADLPAWRKCRFSRLLRLRVDVDAMPVILRAHVHALLHGGRAYAAHSQAQEMDGAS